jgi:hypothetical protein
MSPPLAPITFACANCGARLSVDGSTRMVTCAYCRTETMLPEAVWLQFHPTPEHAPPEVPVPGVPRGALLIGLLVAGVTIVGVGVAAIGAVVAGTRVTATLGPLDSIAKAPLNPIANVAEPCNGRRWACSKDGKAELVCGADDKMAVGGTCKGPNACRATLDGKSIRCDVTLADPDDPCNITDDACSTDHTAELRCEAGHFAVLATCKGPDGCTLAPSKAGDGYTLSCDDHIAEVGDPCFDAQRTACSSDKKALLTCTAQRFVVAHKCKAGCTVRKVVGTGDVEMSCR